MDNEELYRELKQHINKKFEQLEGSDGQVSVSSHDQKILDKYELKVREEFWSSVKEAGIDGLTKDDIMEIFGVGQTRAWNIQKELKAQYEGLEYHRRPGKAALTLHKKSAYIEDLANNTSKSREEILKAMQGRPDGLEYLENEWEKLEKKRKKSKSRRSRF